MITTETLDKRICDCEKGATNTQTYREFIREYEHKYNICPKLIDLYSDEELQKYLDELD